MYGKKKETLVNMCTELKIVSSGKKHEIVERLAVAQKEEVPCLPKLYHGKKVPTSTKEIGLLSLCYLLSILKFHGFPAFQLELEQPAFNCFSAIETASTTGNKTYLL